MNAKVAKRFRKMAQLSGITDPAVQRRLYQDFKKDWMSLPQGQKFVSELDFSNMYLAAHQGDGSFFKKKPVNDSVQS